MDVFNLRRRVHPRAHLCRHQYTAQPHRRGKVKQFHWALIRISTCGKFFLGCTYFAGLSGASKVLLEVHWTQHYVAHLTTTVTHVRRCYLKQRRCHGLVNGNRQKSGVTCVWSEAHETTFVPSCRCPLTTFAWGSEATGETAVVPSFVRKLKVDHCVKLPRARRVRTSCSPSRLMVEDRDESRRQTLSRVPNSHEEYNSHT